MTIRFPVDGTGRLASEREHPTAVLIGPVVTAYTAGQLSAGGIDVWGSQSDPGSVTDWGPVINALVVAGHRHLYFGYHDFPFATKLSFPVTEAITLEGAAAWSNINAPATRLIWGGTGTGTAVDLSHGGNAILTFRDIGFLYSSGSFTGSLFHVDDGVEISGPLWERCTFVSWDFTTCSAKSFISLAQTNNAHIRDCSFQGAQYHIRGYEVGTFGESIICDGCTFGKASVASLSNFGSNSIVSNTQWDVADFPYAYLTDGAAPAYGVNNSIWFDGGNVYDTTTALLGFIKLNQWPPTDLRVSNIQYLPSANTTKVIQHLGSGRVRIEDFDVIGPLPAAAVFVDLGARVALNIKTSVHVTGCDMQDNGQADLIVNRAGHHNLQIWGNSNSGKIREQRTRTGVELIDYSRSPYDLRPGVVAHSGSGTTPFIFGSDREGWLSIDIGGSPVTGLQADVTFTAPLLSPDVDYPFGGLFPMPLVQLTVFESADVHATSVGPGNNGAALGWYVHIPNDLSGFSVGCTTAPPTGKSMMLHYSVVVG